jgi:hypothetical protein
MLSECARGCCHLCIRCQEYETLGLPENLLHVFLSNLKLLDKIQWDFGITAITQISSRLIDKAACILNVKTEFDYRRSLVVGRLSLLLSNLHEIGFTEVSFDRSYTFVLRFCTRGPYLLESIVIQHL